MFFQVPSGDLQFSGSVAAKHGTEPHEFRFHRRDFALTKDSETRARDVGNSTRY